jgi:MoaA/NifB/PqqE/SkfB family radical SAM enzyme
MPDIFRFNNVKIVHLEPTTNCNAACPQCLRTRTEFEPNELSLEDVKKLFTPDVLMQLEKIYMCGNYGDPASARQTLEMYEYFISVNLKRLCGYILSISLLMYSCVNSNSYLNLVCSIDS